MAYREHKPELNEHFIFSMHNNDSQRPPKPPLPPIGFGFKPTINQIEAAWEVEISARIAAWKRGETLTYAAEDVLAQARELCK